MNHPWSIKRRELPAPDGRPERLPDARSTSRPPLVSTIRRRWEIDAGNDTGNAAANEPLRCAAPEPGRTRPTLHLPPGIAARSR